MAENFNDSLGTMFKGMQSILSTKTVVGEPTKVGDTIILPLVDVNFGMAAGAFSKNGGSASGGMGGKMSPSAVLVIQDGHTKMVSVKSEDTVSKVLDMIPEVMDKVSNMLGKKDAEKEQAISDAIDAVSEDEII